MKLSNYPVLKILFPYIIGIFLAYFCNLSDKIVHFIPYLCLTFLLISLLFNHIRHHKWQPFQSISLKIAFVLLGFSLTNFHFQCPFDISQQKTITSNRYWVAQIIDFPVERAKSFKTLAVLKESTDGEKMGGKVLLYIAKSPLSKKLQYGDELLISTKLSEIESPKNPYAFDNQKYMHRKGIFYTGYVPDGAWQKIGSHIANPLKAISHRVQKHLSAIFANAGISGDEYDIIAAILLGDDDTMEPELKTAYASAGVSHILCVSGMHVGVIYMILNFLFKPMDLFKSTRAAKACIILLMIWFYAYITGLSPSVTRSAAMFTFVTVGSLINRNTNIFHSLFASLFILLIINPLLIFDVGFELSYLAVFGIVLFQKPIVKIYTCKTKVGNYFWELMSVSIAAQISTFPISIYYFGQFPNYFLLSNLSVIALSFVVMITGIVLLALSFIKIIAPVLSWILIMEIKIMNGIIHFIDKLPGAVTQNIDYSVIQMLFLYFVIIGIYLLYRYKNRICGWAAYTAFALFSICFVFKKLDIVKEESVTVYDIRKVCALNFTCHGQSILLSDSIHSTSDSYFQYSIKNHYRKQHTHYQIISIDTPRLCNDYLFKYGNYIRFQNRQYYILKRKERLYEDGAPKSIDVLLLEHNPTQKPENVRKALNFKEVLADGSNTAFYIARWRTYCAQQNIAFRWTGD